MNVRKSKKKIKNKLSSNYYIRANLNKSWRLSERISLFCLRMACKHFFLFKVLQLQNNKSENPIIINILKQKQISNSDQSNHFLNFNSYFLLHKKLNQLQLFSHFYLYQQQYIQLIMIKDQIHLLKQYITTLQSENNARNTERVTLENQIITLIKQNQDLQSLLNSNNHKARISESQLMMIQSEIKRRYESEIIELKRLIDNYKKSIDLTKNSSSKQWEYKKIQQQLIQAKKDSELMKIETVKKQEQLNRLKNEITFYKNELENQKRKFEYEIVKYNTNNESGNILNNDLQIIKNQLQEYKNKYECTIHLITKQNSQLHTQIKSLSYELNLKNIEYNTLNKQFNLKCTAWDFQKTDLNTHINNQLANIMTLQSQIKIMRAYQLQTLRNQNYTELNTLKLKEESYKENIIRLTTQVQRLMRLLQQNKHSQVQIISLKQQYNKLLTINSNLQNQNNLMRQNQSQLQYHRMEYINQINLNKELEKTIIMLENSNRNLNEQLIKTSSNSRIHVHKDQIINSLKNELAQYKSINSNLNSINNQLATQIEQKNLVIQNLQIKTNNKKGHHHTQPDEYNNRFKFNSLVMVSPKIDRKKISNVFDKSKWTLLQSKINMLKNQNEQLKKSLNFNNI